MAEHPPVRGAIARDTGTDWSATLNALAAKHGLPSRLIVAQWLAETGLRERAERWAFRDADGQVHNLTGAAQHAIATNDLALLGELVARINAAGSQDISFGVGQQTVRWAPIGTREQTPANILAVRARFLEDVPFAFEVMARQLAHYWRLYVPDGPETMARYNRPVSGLEGNPNAAHIQASWTASAAYVVPEEAPMPSDYTPTVHHDPGTRGGTFAAMPLGVILHGSRSGIAGRALQAEYDGTRRYAASGIELGWHATVGEDAVSIHMPPDWWGWNARRASSRYLAVELAQPTVGDDITDGQVRALCWWLQHEVFPRWPDLAGLCSTGAPSVLPTHAELEALGATGARDGKSDCYPVGDERADDLRARIVVRLAGQEQPEEGDDPMRVQELEAEVARLNDALAAAASWSGATVADVLKPAVADLDTALAGKFTASKRQRLTRTRARLAEWAGVE